MTENTNTKRNERLKPCGCSWCIAAQRRDRMEMGGMVIAPCDEYGRTDREAMAAVGLAEVAAKPEPKPSPWLRGDELHAVMPTLKAGDVVEVGFEGHTATGELWAHSIAGLSLWATVVRWSDGVSDVRGANVHALRIIERAPEPEPGADIPDEVVEAATRAIEHRVKQSDCDSWGPVVRAALAAADAKRAELEGQA